jgi:outer membrane protein assembly factor BamB
VGLPVVSRERVYFGALDNRVYCVKARNGHRVWTAALPGRIDRPLTLWRGPAPSPADATTPVAPADLELVLVIPEGAPRVLALDARDGRQVARLELPEGQGRLVGAPAVTPDSRIAVAWQNYDESRAALIVFELRPAADDASTGLSAAAAAPVRP